MKQITQFFLEGESPDFSKHVSTVKKHKFYFQGKEIEIAEQCIYLGFIFIPSGKKHRGIENL